MKKKILSILLAAAVILSVFFSDFSNTVHSAKDTYRISHIDIFADLTTPVSINGKVYNFEPSLTVDDTQYVSYSGQYADGTPAAAKLSKIGTSEDDARGMQIRLGTESTDDDNYLEAGTEADPVFWTVSLNKVSKVYVKDDTISSTPFDGAVEYEVPLNLSATVDYWSDNNECPGFEDIPDLYSGIDLDLKKDSGTITIQKNISGCELTEDKTFVFNVYAIDPQTGNKTIYSEGAEVTVKAGKTMSQTTLVKVPYGSYSIEEVQTSAQLEGFAVDIQYGRENVVITEENPFGLGEATNVYTPYTYTLTYHVEGDDVYGVPSDSVTPEKVEGIKYNGDEDLDSVPKTSWTTSDGTEDGVPGTWSVSEYWTEDESAPDKADITDGKIEKIKEDKDVYSKWTFVPGEYTLTYHVTGDKFFGVPSDSVTPDKVTGIKHNEDETLDPVPKTSWTTSDGKEDGIPGTWVVSAYWTEDESDPDKADITDSKIEKIKENKDVYAKWTFISDVELDENGNPVPPKTGKDNVTLTIWITVLELSLCGILLALKRKAKR